MYRRLWRFGMSMTLMVACGSNTKPIHLATPEMRLPSASNAVAIPLSDLSLVDYANEEQLMSAVAKHCAEPAETLPTAILKPAVVVATPDAILWNGEKVASLKDGVVSKTDLQGMLITQLYDRVSDQVAQTRQAKSICLRPTAQSNAEERLRALLVLDARIPERTLGTILYTLRQSRIHSFAYAVDDTSPDTTRPTDYVGGLPGIARFGATDTHWTWDLADSEEVLTFPRNTPLKKYLGESEPRAAVLGLHDEHPMDSFVQKQDLLVGAGIRCVSLALMSNASPIVTAPHSTQPSLTTGVPIHEGAMVAVHLLLIPQLTPPGAEPKPVVQADGSQCFMSLKPPKVRPGIRPNPVR